MTVKRVGGGGWWWIVVTGGGGGWKWLVTAGGGGGSGWWCHICDDGTINVKPSQIKLRGGRGIWEV